jgi:hypothetical protein
MSGFLDLEISSNIKGVTNWFDEMLGDADQLQDDILRTAANYEVRATKRRFTTQIGPDGDAWPPPSPLTIKSRKIRRRSGGGGRGNKRGSDSGAMRQDIVPERTKENEIKVTARKHYAIYQQEGFKSRITGKQAWWMVINLYGFNPKKPNKFAEEAFGKSKKGLRRKRNEVAMDAYGRMMANHLWKKLVGRWLVVPPMPFMGFSTQDLEEIEKITLRHVELFLTRRGRIL